MSSSPSQDNSASPHGTPRFQPNSTEASPFLLTAASAALRAEARAAYQNFANKSPTSPMLIRSVMDRDGIELNPSNKLHKVIIDLIDTPAIQRMKYVSQLSAASWAYPDGCHSRFGHVVGSAYLTAQILDALRARSTVDVQEQIDAWGPVCVAFAMTHDLGHIAPGSHVAQRVWFNGQPDTHEEMSHRILRDDPYLQYVLQNTLGTQGPDMLNRVVSEDASVPKWTWQLITGGGWNTDRGDWVPRDSKLLGVGYGEYELPIIKKNLEISKDGELLIGASGVSALEAFFSARADMYRNVYQHPTTRIGEKLHELVGRRARELFAAGSLEFADETMQAVLSAKTGADLSVATMLNMNESWWQYHVSQWSKSNDPIVQELSGRVLRREPFRHFANTPEQRQELLTLIEQRGLDPKYYLLEVGEASVNLEKDLNAALRVRRHDGTVEALTTFSVFMRLLNEMKRFTNPGFIAVPEKIFLEQAIH